VKEQFNDRAEAGGMPSARGYNRRTDVLGGTNNASVSPGIEGVTTGAFRAQAVPTGAQLRLVRLLVDLVPPFLDDLVGNPPGPEGPDPEVAAPWEGVTTTNTPVLTIDEVPGMAGEEPSRVLASDLPPAPDAPDPGDIASEAAGPPPPLAPPPDGNFEEWTGFNAAVVQWDDQAAGWFDTDELLFVVNPYGMAYDKGELVYVHWHGSYQGWVIIPREAVRHAVTVCDPNQYAGGPGGDKWDAGLDWVDCDPDEDGNVPKYPGPGQSPDTYAFSFIDIDFERVPGQQGLNYTVKADGPHGVCQNLAPAVYLPEGTVIQVYRVGDRWFTAGGGAGGGGTGGGAINFYEQGARFGPFIGVSDIVYNSDLLHVVQVSPGRVTLDPVYASSAGRGAGGTPGYVSVGAQSFSGPKGFPDSLWAQGVTPTGSTADNAGFIIYGSGDPPAPGAGATNRYEWASRTWFQDSASSLTFGEVDYTTEPNPVVSGRDFVTHFRPRTGTGGYGTVNACLGVWDSTGAGGIGLWKVCCGLNFSGGAFTSGDICVYPNWRNTATYTLIAGDRGKLVYLDYLGGTQTLTLPSPATAGFGNGWWCFIENAGGTATLDPGAALLDGAATLTLTTGQGVLLATDGATWYTSRGMGSGGGGSLPDPVTVPHGGTGDTTLTDHGVLIGQGTAAVAVTAAATDGEILTGVTGGNPVWLAPPTGNNSNASGAFVLSTAFSLTSTTYTPVTDSGAGGATMQVTLPNVNGTYLVYGVATGTASTSGVPQKLNVRLYNVTAGAAVPDSGARIMAVGGAGSTADGSGNYFYGWITVTGSAGPTIRLEAKVTNSGSACTIDSSVDERTKMDWIRVA
jgi:hypothetical protein